MTVFSSSKDLTGDPGRSLLLLFAQKVSAKFYKSDILNDIVG